MANNWVDLGNVWSGRDLDEGEPVTVSVFDKAKQTLLEQTTFVPKSGRLDQYTWAMDLCEQVNTKLKLICAGVQAGDKLEIQNSGYLNRFWGLTDQEVQVITTAPHKNNWPGKSVGIRPGEFVLEGDTLELKVRNSKGDLLETVSFKVAPGRTYAGSCSEDFAHAINRTSLFVRAGFRDGNTGIIKPFSHSEGNNVWIPFNADFTLTCSLIQSKAWTVLGELLSGRDLAEGERVTVNVFDKATQDVLEQTTFVAKAGRLGKEIWVKDLCEQVKAQLKLIKVGVKVGDKLEIQESYYLNKFWSNTDRDVQVVTTTAYTQNWTSRKGLTINLVDDVKAGSVLQLKVFNSKGQLLETVKFSPAPGRSACTQCMKDFATEINNTSLYVRAGGRSGPHISPLEQLNMNDIWIPSNADFKVSWSIEEEHEDDDWSIDLTDTFTELGEVWSGRDLAEGERVTISVFDKDLHVLVEQTTFVPKPGHTGQYLWPMEMCRHVNATLASISAGTMDEQGNWGIAHSGHLNKYWTWTSRNLVVVTTVARSDNWTTGNRVNIDIARTLAADAVLRVNVRSKSGVLLETLTFTPGPGRNTAGPCGHDLARHINNTSLYLRAGAQSTANTSLIQPDEGAGKNWIWFPFNAEFSVTWSVDEAKEACKIQADRDAVEGERISLFVFDDSADRLLDRITLTGRASKGNLGKDKWPAALAKQINDASGHAKASGSVVNRNYMELRLFTTSLHLDNWVEASKITASEKLTAADRIVVKVSTSTKGNFCEALTFTPDPARLEAKQWANDLARYINEHSHLLKAGVKDATKKTYVPAEDAGTNGLWLPKDSKLKVAWEKTRLKELAPVYLEHDMVKSEACKAYVLDDATDTILREMTFTPAEGRTGRYSVPRDLAALINQRTELVRAGDKSGDAAPVPASSYHANKIWSQASGVRAFTTLNDMLNFDKGSAIGDRDLVENEQVRVIVKGKQSGRILEAMSFTPADGRLGHEFWSRDVAHGINVRSSFIRAGQDREEDHRIEAVYEANSNFFWIPQGSGLEVEMKILSRFALQKPGMTHEAKALFEQYVEAKKYISVDARTGKGTLHIPLAEFFSDDSFKHPLKFGVGYDKYSGIHIQLGGGRQRVRRPFADDDFVLTLKDGRNLLVGRKMSPVNGGDFKVDLVEEPIELVGEVTEATRVVGLKVSYKDGCIEVFDFAEEIVEPESQAVLNLSQYTLPSGQHFQLKYGAAGQLEKIIKGNEVVLEAHWEKGTYSKLQMDMVTEIFSVTLSSIVVFPGQSREKRTFIFAKESEEGLKVKFKVDGIAATGTIFYTINLSGSGELTGIEVEQQHAFTVDKKEITEKAHYSESLEYINKKISRHAISPGGGMDDLVQDYVYSGASTTLTGYFKNASPRSTFVRQFEFLDHHTVSESHGSAAVPYSKRRSQRLDTTEKRAITETCIWEGDVLVDRQALSVDAVGNPVESINNDEITRRTYYNNYQQFKVTETEVKVEDWSLFGCLFKIVDYTVGGAVYSIGNKGGMTWGTRIDTEVDMVPAVNDYAQKAFSLPVAIVHCGSDKPFSGEAESELVLRKVGDKEVPQRLTFYGYANVDGRIRAKQKLTILQPDCVEVDVTDVQYKVAEKAAKPFTENLEKQIAASSGDVKKAFESTLKELTESLKAQSEANCKGYKLNSKKAASIVLETYDYHTDKDKPGYGTVKSTESVQILESGEALETSRVKTEYEYSVDPADSSKLTIKTTVSRGKEDKIISSQTRSRLSGRLLGSTDTEGNVSVRTYDPQGNLTSETVTDAAKNTRETTCTLARGLVWQQDMVQDGLTTRIERDALGRKVAEAVKPDGTFLETRRWTFDSIGRVASCVETDYGAGDAKIAIRESIREYDELTGEVIVTNLLKDGAGKTLNQIVQNQTPLLRGERFKQGAFTVDRQYNPNKRIMTELYSYKGMDSGKIERRMSAEGLTTSVRYLTIDDKNTETEQDKQDFEYDGYGQLSKVTPTFGAPISYTYDAAGRLLSTTRDGAVFSNTYDTHSLATVATEGKASDGTNTLTLGKQTVDLLGRAKERTVSGQKIEYKYSGASTRAERKKSVAGPTALGGYESSHDKKTRTLTQKLGGKSSTVVFSTGGRVVSFTDLTGAKTTYEYDFANRITKSSNDHCVHTCSYLGNGLLGQETITAVKEDNLVMTVTYTYDGLGQEIRRVFDCPGVDSVELHRILLGDGRLSKSELEVKGTVMYVDSYKYDTCLRLSAWNESELKNNAMREGFSKSFEYDVLGSLISEGNPAGSFANSFKSPVDPNEEPTLYAYDTAGRITQDRNGFIWNYHENGQAKSFTIPEANSTYTFTYDNEGRIRGGSDSGGWTDSYHYCGDRVYALVQTDSTQGQGYSTRTLVLRNESRSCLMQDAITDGRESRSFELRDASGTIIASVNLATKTIAYLRYWPYGSRYAGETSERWLGFKGEPINRMGLYHLGNGYRMYDPAIGCFLSPDDKAPFGIGGVAAYGFGNGDPVNHKDPSGHEVVAEYSRWGTVPAIQSTAFRVVVGAIGVLLAPFTAGSSILLAVATTALAAISFAFDVASIIVSQSDPELAKTLEAWGQAFGIAGAAAGVAMTVHGWKSIPRHWFRPRGGPSLRAPVKPLGSMTREASVGMQRCIKEGTQMMVAEAKAAGKTRTLTAAYMDAEPSMVGAGVAPGLSLDTRFHQRAGNAAKNLYKGTVAQFDDSLLDLMGHILDAYTGPNVIVQKFVPPMVSETEVRSLVGLPMPGRENLFK